MVQVLALEENLSISTGLATRPSRLSPKNCINKSICLATGGAPSMGTPRLPSGCQQINLFMHFLGARVLMASVEMDKISSSGSSQNSRIPKKFKLICGIGGNIEATTRSKLG